MEFLRGFTAPTVAKRVLKRGLGCRNGVSEENYSPLSC